MPRFIFLKLLFRLTNLFDKDFIARWAHSHLIIPFQKEPAVQAWAELSVDHPLIIQLLEIGFDFASDLKGMDSVFGDVFGGGLWEDVAAGGALVAI